MTTFSSFGGSFKARKAELEGGQATHDEKTKMSKLKKVWNSFRSLRSSRPPVEKEGGVEGNSDDEREFRIKQWLQESSSSTICSEEPHIFCNTSPTLAKHLPRLQLGDMNSQVLSRAIAGAPRGRRATIASVFPISEEALSKFAPVQI